MACAAWHVTGQRLERRLSNRRSKLRIALLAMLEPAGMGQPFPRAFLRVGGATLAQHQFGLALAMDCQRLICLARGPSGELIALQHAAEAAGMRFHIVSGAQQLSALVTANDELIVITEGLFADAAAAASLLDEPRPTVLALPDEGAVAEGFERIDINHAAAGIMKIPGSLVERLHDLPPDCDVPSALTRIALQSGARMQTVPSQVRAGSNWRMVRGEAEALALEVEWLRARLVASRTSAPSDKLARMGVLAFGSSLLHAGNASGAASLAAALALVLALGMAWLGTLVPAFVQVAVAWLLVCATELLRRAERQAHSVAAPSIPRSHVLGWLVDGSLIVLCVLAMVPAAGLPALPLEYRVFSPVMLILMVHLSPRLLPGSLAVLIGDRAVLALVLGLATAFGYAGAAVHALAVLLAMGALFLVSRRVD